MTAIYCIAAYPDIASTAGIPGLTSLLHSFKVTPLLCSK